MSMKDKTSITQNINFNDNRMSGNEKLKLVIDDFKIFFTDEMIKLLHITQIYTVLSKILPKIALQQMKWKDTYVSCLKCLLYKHPIIEYTGKLIHGMIKYVL